MNEAEHDDNTLEISDLPGQGKQGKASTFLGVLETRPRLRSRLWQAGIVICLLCLIFVALPGYYPLLRTNLSGLFAHTPQPSVVASVTSQSASIIAGQDVQARFSRKRVLIWINALPGVLQTATLAATPVACQQNTLTQNFDSPLFQPGVGGAPLWVTGFTGSHAVLNHFAQAHPPELGWYQQIQLVGATNLPGAITLQGGMVGSGFPLWFGFDQHEKRLIVSYQFNPADSSISNHTTDDQQWSTRPINLYIFQAGCYYLQATWEGGSWIVYFAAGR